MSNNKEFLIIIPYFDLLISLFPNFIQKCFCTPNGAIDLTFQMEYVQAFLQVCSYRNWTKYLEIAKIQTARLLVRHPLLHFKNSILQIASKKMLLKNLTNWILPIGSYKLHFKNCLLQIAFCKLHLLYYILQTAYQKLHLLNCSFQIAYFK